MKKAIKNQLTVGKILIILGGLWIIIYSILSAANVYKPDHYGWLLSWQIMLVMGIIYFITPYSVKPDIWTRLWAIAICALSVYIIVYCFTRPELDYNLVWTYLNPLPHFVVVIGTVFWFIQGK
ncbi:MAG: hypothetical protein REH79_03270 [Spiroplasma sp.]|nr:hypothetical protein [Spiroplasma sp.]